MSSSSSRPFFTKSTSFPSFPPNTNPTFPTTSSHIFYTPSDSSSSSPRARASTTSSLLISPSPRRFSLSPFDEVPPTPIATMDGAERDPVGLLEARRTPFCFRPDEEEEEEEELEQRMRRRRMFGRSWIEDDDDEEEDEDGKTEVFDGVSFRTTKTSRRTGGSSLRGRSISANESLGMQNGSLREWAVKEQVLEELELDGAAPVEPSRINHERVDLLTSMLEGLQSRVSYLEQDNVNKDRELGQLRAYVSSSSSSSHHTPSSYPSPSTPPPHPPGLYHQHQHHQTPYHFPQYQHHQPHSYHSPSSSSPYQLNGYTSTPPHRISPSSSFLTQPLQPHARPFTPISGTSTPYTTFSPSYPPSPESPLANYGVGASQRQRTETMTSFEGRGVLYPNGGSRLMNGSSVGAANRERGLSLSAIAPIAAQAHWLNKHQSTNSLRSSPTTTPSTSCNSLSTPPSISTSLEPINFRSLLEHDSDIPDDLFVQRVVKYNDQQCSLFLQQRVRSSQTSEERRKNLMEAVKKELKGLSFSKFGNFLTSRVLEVGGKTVALEFTKLLEGELKKLSLDSFGCHVVQRLIDVGEVSTKDRVIEELMGDSLTLLTKASCHVWNRILSTPSNPPSFYAQLAETGKGNWVNITREEGGSMICQHLLDEWGKSHASLVAEELFDQLESVACSPCGGFVLASLLDRNALPFRAKLMEIAPRLALDPLGIKILEKSIRTGRVTPSALSTFIQELVEIDNDSTPLVVKVSLHPNGAQLVAMLLTGHSNSQDKNKLIKALYEHSTTLKQSPSGVKVALLVEKQL